jgi:hypothetical protein
MTAAKFMPLPPMGAASQSRRGLASVHQGLNAAAFG